MAERLSTDCRYTIVRLSKSYDVSVYRERLVQLTPIYDDTATKNTFVLREPSHYDSITVQRYLSVRGRIINSLLIHLLGYIINGIYCILLYCQTAWHDNAAQYDRGFIRRTFMLWDSMSDIFKYCLYLGLNGEKQSSN